MIARVCISVISGYVMPSRTPRWPSIGLNSCSCSTRCSSLLLLVVFRARWSRRSPPSSRCSHHQVFALRQELVQRRIDRPNRDRRSVHLLEHAVEVAALQRQQLVQRRAPILLVVGEDHLLDDGNPALAEEHVLGAAEADAARAEVVGDLRLIGLIGVRADAEPAELVRPRQQLVEAAVDVRLLPAFISPLTTCRISLGLRRDLADLDFAGEPVEREPVAFLQRLCRRCAASCARSSISSAPAPTTDGLPIWRPTTAACDVMPPVAVRMPCATNMPWMSSGTVSLRTSIDLLALPRPLDRVDPP